MFIQLIISFIIGAVIGLERSSPQKLTGDKKKIVEPHDVGVRTFSLISLLGTLAGLMIEDHFPVFIFVSVMFGLLAILYYFLQTWNTKDAGITTELALIYTYMLGIMIGREILPIQLIILVAVVLVLVLSRKREIQDFIVGIKRNEINAFISYGLIALVVLPFLRNTDYSLSDIPNSVEFFSRVGINMGSFANVSLLNPFKLWFIVALITGIDVAGYLLERTLGNNRGRVISSLAGGFISSTATTQALAQESKRNKSSGLLAGAALFANMVSFIPLFFLIGSVNSSFLIGLMPILLSVIISCALVGSYYYFFHRDKNKKSKAKAETHKEKSIFSLGSALTFVVIFAIVRVASQVALVVFGSSGVIVTTSIAALTGVDAPILTVSQMVGQEISLNIGIWTFVLINAVNLIAKSFYSFLQGSRGFAVRFVIGVAIVITSSVIWPLFINR